MMYSCNKARYLDGGAMYCFECSITLVNSQFSYSAAILSEGGGMFLTNCSVTINGSQSVNNKAFTGGTRTTCSAQQNYSN